MGGDFRQCATVIERGSKADIISASLPQSSLWRNMTALELTINMRVLRAEGQPYLWKLAEGRKLCRLSVYTTISLEINSIH